MKYVSPKGAADILGCAYPSVFKILSRAKIERAIGTFYRRAEVEKLAEVRKINPPKSGRPRSGLTPIKSKNPPNTQRPLSRLISSEVEILRRYRDGIPIADLAQSFKVSRSWMNTFIRNRIGEETS